MNQWNMKNFISQVLVPTLQDKTLSTNLTSVYTEQELARALDGNCDPLVSWDTCMLLALAPSAHIEGSVSVTEKSWGQNFNWFLLYFSYSWKPE